MKKEELLALIAELPDGADVRIPPPIVAPDADTEPFTFDKLRWYDRLLCALAGLMVLFFAVGGVLLIIGYAMRAIVLLLCGEPI